MCKMLCFYSFLFIDIHFSLDFARWRSWGKDSSEIVYLGSTGNTGREKGKGSRVGKEAKKSATTVNCESLIQRGNSETRRKTHAWKSISSKSQGAGIFMH